MNRKEAYEFLYRLAKGLASMFGPNCETVIQEVVKNEMVTLAIFNGHVSGREPQSKLGILGGALGENLNYDKVMVDVCNQMVIHPSGKKIKSSSFVMAGKDFKFALGVNYDVTMMEKAEESLKSFLAFEGNLYNTLQSGQGNTLEGIFDTCLRAVHEPGKKMTKVRRTVLIQMLNEHSFFALQKSVQYLADRLGLSKYTIYKDLNELGIR